MKKQYFIHLFALVLAFLYGALLVLWLQESAGLHWMLDTIWGVKGVYIPGQWYARAPLPFFDLAGTLSWRECYLRGFDVMAHNPCDPLQRPSNYSPLWYLLPTGGIKTAIPLGLLMDAVFIAALPLALAPRSWCEFWVALAATLSPVVVFAVERANVDVLMFVMMLAALWLWRHNREWMALAAILAAGALKFYPLAMLIIFASALYRRLLMFCAVALVSVTIFVACFWSELMRIPGLMPPPIYFGDNFGAALVALAARDELGLPPFVTPLLRYALTAASLLAGWRLSMRWPPLNPPAEHSALMLAGSAIMAFCFLSSTNVGYRAIFLLALLPGVIALRSANSRLSNWGIAAIMFCLYAEPLRLGSRALELLIYGSDPNMLSQELPEVAYFLLHEGFWWFLVVLMLAIQFAWLRQLPRGNQRAIKA
ncbi:MAG: hypothetical protein JO256_12305 [Alphaproteobacteria bacterium]|nr:hypothetical protein [Alphaproteobacteria bacterium]